MKPRPPTIGLSLSGIWYRRAISIMILIVAAAGVAAGTIGVSYADAGRTSVIREALREAPTRGWELLFTGPGWPDSTEPHEVVRDRVPALFDITGGAEFFGPPVVGMEYVDRLHDDAESLGRFSIVARDDICAHVRLIAGSCPADRGEVLVSAGAAAELGWEVGDDVLLASFVQEAGESETGEAADESSDEAAAAELVPIPLPIVGIYQVPDRDAPYWNRKGTQYFPAETGKAFAPPETAPQYEALLTSFETFTYLSGPTVASAGSAYATLALDPDMVTGSNADEVLAVLADLRLTLAEQRVRGVPTFRVLITDLDRVIRDAQHVQNAFSAPAALITIQVVALTWVLLVVLVNTVVEARAGEVGLARLRGLSWWAVRRFAGGEIAVLVVLAAPIGVVAGMAAARPLAAHLGPGISFEVTPLMVLVAASITAGGLLAAAAATQRTVSRALAEQWRVGAARPRRRGWVLDVALVALAAAGFIELTTGGPLGGVSSHSALTLLAPGLCALASAVIAARFLPLAARAVLGVTRRHGGISAFLAVRRIARGIGTATTLVVLVTALGLVTFAAAAWSSARANHREVATSHLGADTVLNVTAPDSAALADTVQRIDPEGDDAAFVLKRSGRGATLVGVDPRNFAGVAHWRDNFASESLPELMSAISTSPPPQVMVSGDRIRVTSDLLEAPEDHIYRLVAEFETPGSTSLVRVHLGEVRPGPPAVGQASLPDCPDGCELRGFMLEFAPDLDELDLNVDPSLAEVEVAITDVTVRDSAGWHSVDAGLRDSGRWRVPDSGDSAAWPTSDGLLITGMSYVNMHVVPVTYPLAIPAVTTGGTQPDPNGVPVIGLDERDLTVFPVTRARAVPGVSTVGALVDLELAERVAVGSAGQVEYQVWCAPGAADRIRAALEAAGVTVIGEQRSADVAERFATEGPGLALRLLLAIGVAAALLAAGATVIELHATSRRRRYEIAALGTVGASRRSLRTALLIEHAVILGTASLIGPAAGLLASSLAVSKIPTFAVAPHTPPLRYPLDLSTIMVVASAAFALAAVAALVMTVTIVRGTRADQLREAPV